MPTYPRLASLLTAITPATLETVFVKDVIPYLVDVWVDDYDQSTNNHDIVETTVADFSYLFDVALGRLIAAWGISKGRHSGARDKSRMAGHPLTAVPGYHRGHAIPHTLGGATDINLVAQLGSVNIGPFRVLERQAVATPGALYFTYWIYGRGTDQRPTSVQQGFVCSGRAPEIRTHAN
ncbi:MAG TPA: hypothetical protein VJT81_03115 [Burkholderiales bacterium]|nr:hypothetical protein [Burkholderiales bacterium]